MPPQNPITLPLEIAIEPRSREDLEKMLEAIPLLIAEDSSLGFQTDEESGQTILRGIAEFQLDAAISQLMNDFDIALIVGAPQVAYRETVSREAEIDYTHKKQSGGARQFARIKLVITPTGPGEGYSFENRVGDGSVPRDYIPGVEMGIQSVMGKGPLAGFPVIDFKVSLIDSAFHDIDNSVLAFEVAARSALRVGLKKAGAKLLEPVERVEIVVPADCTQRVIGDLFTRRGVVQVERKQGANNTICAFVPVSTMFGYISTLRSISSGRGKFTMTFSHYQDVPKLTSGPDGPENFPPAIGMRA